MSYRDTNVPDITNDSIRANAEKWLSIMRYGEYGVVIQPQDDCEYRVDQIIHNPNLLKRILGPYYRKYLFGYVPVDKKNLMEALHTEIKNICLDRKIDMPRDSSNLKKLINTIGTKGYEIGIFISRINNLLEEPGFKTILELEYLLENTLNFSVIVFSEKDLTHPKYSTLIDKCSLLFDHILKFPLYSEKDCEQFVNYNNSMWSMKLDKKIKRQIIDACGGYLWLISTMQRYIRDNPNATFEETITDERLFLKLDNIFHKLTTIEQELIIKTHDHLLSDKDKNLPEYKHLVSVKFIKETKGIPLLGIPLFSLVIVKEKNLRQIILKDGKIYISHDEINHVLTPNERTFLHTLLINQRRLVTLDILAQKIWGDSWEEKYSDWALDKLAFRLRKKLTLLGLNKTLLKTAKRKGFIFG